MNFNFLTLDEILKIHQDQIQRYGGIEGVRDWGLFKSVLAMPMAGYGGTLVHTDIFEMAAAYLFHIVRNHPFLDENKRTGAVAAYVFLAINSITLNAPPRSFERIVRMASEGKTDKASMANFFRKNVE